MGVYIQHDSEGKNLPMKGKALALKLDGATVVSGTEFVPNMICVVENGSFDAAGWAFDEREFEAFHYGEYKRDKRVRTWFVVDDIRKYVDGKTVDMMLKETKEK